MAFIIVQHQSPDLKSDLVNLLSFATEIPVQEIEDMQLIKPDNVYVIPSDKDIEVVDGHIKLLSRPDNRLTNVTIDLFFSSLAETHKEDAIGIVLSGNAHDGTLGLKAIKQEGGITFAQDESAKFPSMPKSAIDEGVADFILSPTGIAFELTRISRHAAKGIHILKAGSETAIDDGDYHLKAILQLLYKVYGIDFSSYKMGTIKRRMLRRMFLYQLPTLREYFDLLKTVPTEIGILYNDLLINVTHFFREPASFQYLKTTLFPKLLKNKPSGEMLRIWITACSTGQEAYSVAMILLELLGDDFPERRVQIFASDLSEPAIKRARLGEYSKHEVIGVSQKRLEQFFTPHGGNYRIAKSVRDLCSFAPHNILGDPPFSRIDFISCCNMLIYFDTELQKKVLTTFQYALNDNGYLMLGNAETIGTSELFAPTNTKLKLYSRKKGVRILPSLSPRLQNKVDNNPIPQSQKMDLPLNTDNINTAINSVLFSKHLPACVVITRSMEIIQFKGPTSNYLEHSTGKATLNILSLARPEIAFELRNTINKAIETNSETHKAGLEIKNGSAYQTVSLNVVPIVAEGKDLLLVIFKDEVVRQDDNFSDNISAESLHIKKLKEELVAIRAELLHAMEEKDAANMVLQAVNEEILSSNEEFQSMNEELHTSKEEIECTNEELITTNQELQTRNGQLAEANEFSEAIISTLHESILIVDKDLLVKSCNNAFCRTFHVIKQEIEGKPLFELSNKQWDIPDLRRLFTEIIPRDGYFYDYEIANVFPEIGKKTLLLNARRIVQNAHDDKLTLLAFTDTTEITRKRKIEKQGLEDIISERTKALELSYSILEEKNVCLEKMNKELETFTYISSHDLQEPLRKIKNFVSVLTKDEEVNLSPRGKEYLNRMQESVKRMQMLIEDLLLYSAIQNNRSAFEITDMTKVAEDVIREMEETLHAHDATVSLDGLCETNIIPFQFRQLLQNLIANSLKFSDPERMPHVVIKNIIVVGDTSIHENLIAGTKYCHLAVIDNGIGFAPIYKDRIFEVFQRLHEYDAYKGTGMGLAICKRILENHHGVITATAIPGKGAQFDIYIPAIDDDSLPDATSDHPASL